MKELSLRELQFAELEILKYFDNFCRENELKYSLAGGTLLGAVRHKGFIPWDDDIDVCMPRPDYEKFVSSFKHESLFITHDRESNAKYPFTKILDKKVMLNHEGFSEVENLWIDVFPVDGLPENDKRLAKIYKKSTFYRKVIGFNQVENFDKYHGRHNKIVAKLIGIFAKIYGYKRAIRNSIKLAQKYDYEKSDFVGAVTWGCYGVGERMVKSEYEKFIEMEFEGYNFFVMGCWDSYLHGIYGDYMQLPPEDKRVTHGIQAFKVEHQ